VPVEVDLQPAWQAGGNPDVTQPQLFVEEIEVIVQALAIVQSQEGLACVLVMSGLVDRTGLHRRNDANKAGMFAAPGQRLLYQIFLPDISLADKFDLDPVGGRQSLGVLTQPVSEPPGKFGVIEDPHLPGVQIRRHAFGVAELRQRAENQYPIQASQLSCDMICEPISQ
jgi:hypothetical protein